MGPSPSARWAGLGLPPGSPKPVPRGENVFGAVFRPESGFFFPRNYISFPFIFQRRHLPGLPPGTFFVHGLSHPS